LDTQVFVIFLILLKYRLEFLAARLVDGCVMQGQAEMTGAEASKAVFGSGV
jgi:hypothetical protein